MTIDFIKPYPGEDELSFGKRKAYFYRHIYPRIVGTVNRLEGMERRAVSLDEQERKRIDDFWDRYLAEEVREKLVNYRYYECYKGIKSPETDLLQYIPDTFFKFVDDYYSNPQDSKSCDDKNAYDLYFHDINRPKTLFRRIKDLFLDADYVEITLEQAIKIAKEQPEVICKIAKNSSGGRGLLIWNPLYDDESKLREFLNSSEFIVCQDMIKQHSVLSRINPSSINTLRIFTLLFKGKVNVLSSVLRMGINESRVDNASQGGLVCGIKPNGQLKDVAWTVLGDKFLKHPRGVEFNTVVIPNYNECIDFVSVLAKRMSSFSRLISWDLAIDEAGHPLLIECNLTCTGTESLQIPNGPLLGNLTIDVLDEVFEKSFTLKSIIKSF